MRTLISAVGLALLFAIALPREPVELFGYHGWRKAQTFAGYRCLQRATSLAEGALCTFATTPGFDDQHYVGLELSLFQLVDLALAPHQTTTDVTTVLPFASLCAVLCVLVSSLLWWGRPWQGAALACALVVAVLGSPVLSFLAQSYQPDLFSAALGLGGLAVVLRSKRGWLGVGLMGLAVLARPIFLLLFAAALPWPAERPRWKSQAWRRWLRLVGSLLAPVAVLVGVQRALRLSGVAEYPHHLIDFSVLTWRDLWLQVGAVASQLGVLSVWGWLAVLSVLGARVARVERTTTLLQSLAIVLAFFVTLAIFLAGFRANTYYSLALGLMLGLLTLLLTARAAERSEPVAWRPSAVSAALVAVLGLLLVATRKGPLPEDDARELRAHRTSHCGEVANVLAGRSPIYLDCMTFDPSCRAALDYRGTNLYHELLRQDPARTARLVEERAYYAVCAPYSEGLEADAELSGLVAAHATRLFLHGDTAVYRFGAP